MAKAQVLRQRMVEDLAQRGELDERWRAAFTEVARHAFIPELVWRQNRDSEGNCDLVPLHRAEDPQRWLELAYANDSIITQVDRLGGANQPGGRDTHALGYRVLPRWTTGAHRALRRHRHRKHRRPSLIHVAARPTHPPLHHRSDRARF